ncbi:MAG: hypothetical protein IAG13_00845, partial [Deltaproteobacteria bacterium]|nr:hypothetical protein [Nannocystaceae bacterium]
SMLTLAACVAEPIDGEVIANFPTTTVPTINGWALDPNLPVAVQARNSSGTFVEIATTTSAPSGWSWDGSTWYGWSISNLVVPAAYWTPKPFGCGTRATLRVEIGDFYAQSLDQPWAECWDPEGTLSDFLDNCTSDNSPLLTIETCGALCC